MWKEARPWRPREKWNRDEAEGSTNFTKVLVLERKWTLIVIVDYARSTTDITSTSNNLNPRSLRNCDPQSRCIFNKGIRVINNRKTRLKKTMIDDGDIIVMS